MTGVFSYKRGASNLLISIPHDGREIPADIAATMTDEGRAIPDTDWHVRQLYDAARTGGASVIAANFSRYVVDLNRPASDDALYEGQVSTGLCPLKTFAGEPIYKDGGAVDSAEMQRRIEKYWRPYHTQLAASLAEIRKQHGYALLWDAHSIRSAVPLLFEGELPDLNIGTNDGLSCPANVREGLAEAADEAPYSAVLDARFKGGYITRRYGKPGDRVYAVQLELAQHCYMDEATLRYDTERASQLAKTIEALLAIYRASALIAVTEADMDAERR